MEKICRICGIPKEVINFSYRKDTSNYRNECIECYKEIRKKYKNNPERNREDQKRHSRFRLMENRHPGRELNPHSHY